MLPALPSVPGDLVVLQHWFGFAGVLIVLASIVFGWRRMNREDTTSRQQASSPLVPMQQYYFDGAIKEAFSILEDHADALFRIESKMDWMIRHRARRLATDQPPDQAPPRRPRSRI